MANGYINSGVGGKIDKLHIKSSDVGSIVVVNKDGNLEILKTSSTVSSGGSTITTISPVLGSSFNTMSSDLGGIQTKLEYIDSKLTSAFSAGTVSGITYSTQFPANS